MILTCPRCATRYVVGEDQARPQGRKVKCTSCGEVWTAQTAPPTDPDSSVPAFELPARDRLGRPRVALWSGLAVVAAVALAAVVFQSEIERQWPSAQRAYRAVGL